MVTEENIDIIKINNNYTSITKNLALYCQKYNYSCGPATMKLVYGCFGVEYDEETLIQELNTRPEEGTDWIDMIRHPYERGYNISFLNYSNWKALYRNWMHGFPIIVGWMSPNGGVEEGHYSVVKYMDKQCITLADTAEGKEIQMKKDAFISVWHDDETSAAFLVIWKESEYYPTLPI